MASAITSTNVVVLLMMAVWIQLLLLLPLAVLFLPPSPPASLPPPPPPSAEAASADAHPHLSSPMISLVVVNSPHLNYVNIYAHGMCHYVDVFYTRSSSQSSTYITPLFSYAKEFCLNESLVHHEHHQHHNQVDLLFLLSGSIG